MFLYTYTYIMYIVHGGREQMPIFEIDAIQLSIFKWNKNQL